jgi:hypothetical protein
MTIMFCPTCFASRGFAGHVLFHVEQLACFVLVHVDSSNER